MLDLSFTPDRSRAEPVYRQLAEFLEQQIESGRLADGQKLPASRELARALHLSRNTVNQAYQSLIDRDRLRAHVGQGTFVIGSGARPAAAPPEPARAFVWESLFAAPAATLPEARSAYADRPVPFDFQPGRVDSTRLPLADLKRLFPRVLEREAAALANHLDPCGWPALREAVARALGARGVWCGADDVLITGGAQSALDALLRVLVEPGDAVALETPGYAIADGAFRLAGARRIPVPVDEEGLRTSDLERVLQRQPLKLVYTTPAVQMPTGVALSDERRAKLLDLAEATHTPILEDDYEGELRLDDPIRPALKTLDEAGQVIMVGTFSKALFPSLRLGYVVAAPSLLGRLASIVQASALAQPALIQAVLAEWMEGEGYARHVRRVRREIAERVDAALEVLAAEMPEGTEARRPAGGGTLWIRLPNAVDPAALRLAAREAGVRVIPGDWYATGDAHDPALARIVSASVTALSEGDVREGLGRLAEAARGAMR